MIMMKLIRKEEVKKMLEDNGFKVDESTVDNRRITVHVGDERLHDFITLLPKDFIDFSEKKETLEDYFMSFYKEDREYGGIK